MLAGSIALNQRIRAKLTEILSGSIVIFTGGNVE